MTKKTRKALIAPVRSLGDLMGLASVDPQYGKLALVAAANLGGRVNTERVEDTAEVARAMKWLRTNASETSEDGVVDEVNACRDLL